MVANLKLRWNRIFMTQDLKNNNKKLKTWKSLNLLNIIKIIKNLNPTHT